MSVGENGIWTANYTSEWIKNELIPAVLQYYGREIPKNLIEEIRRITEQQPKYIPFSEIHKPQDLALYIRDIQTWFSSYRTKISINVITSYYETLIELIKYANANDVNMGYISGKLSGEVDCEFQTDAHYRPYRSITEIIKYLSLHIHKIHMVGFEEPRVADNISRAFITIIEEGKFHKFDQSDLNKAKKVVVNLWKESRFEVRYVFPNFSRMI